MRFSVQTRDDKMFLVPECFVDKNNIIYGPFQPISKIKDLHTQPKSPEFDYSRDLQQFLQGKRLLLDEIPFSLEELHEHYLHGYIQYEHGIITKSKIRQQFFCKRCGNQNEALFASFACARCHEPNCTYCRHCIMMGRISQCTPLLTWTGPKTNEHHTSHLLNWTGQLSPGQQLASTKVVEAITKKSDLFVWAVCGSGKTEVLFQGILTALEQGKRICVTTPRTDVVLELTPRLKQAFPKTPIVSLYGGSDDRRKSAQLTIATTHQLLRYYKNFDVIIIDEVDAFPYSADLSLQYAVEQAKKEDAATIYLTATPSEEFKKKANMEKIDTVTIPARYHRHPLPVPTFHWCGNWKKQLHRKQSLPTNVKEWVVSHLQTKKQAFLFVPDIDTLNKVVAVLQKEHSAIDGVHAEDPLRKEKVQAFRSGEIPIIVTTTILERGVTVPNTDVAVLGAEDSIFTESALVQIAGRVGRSLKYPTGEVVFFHYGKTNAMVAAKKQILRMNEEGKRLGLLD